MGDSKVHSLDFGTLTLPWLAWHGRAVLILAAVILIEIILTL